MADRGSVDAGQESKDGRREPAGAPNETPASTAARARALIEKSRTIGASVSEDNPGTAAEQGQASALPAEALRQLEQLKESKKQVDQFTEVIRTLREAIEKDSAEKLLTLAGAAKKAREQADAQPEIQDLARAAANAEDISQAASVLLLAPLGEDARRSQDRLLGASAITLLLSGGLVSIENMTVLVQLKFDPSKLALVVAASGLACIYFLVAFLAAYVRDTRVGQVLRANALVKLRPTWKRILVDHASRLEAQVIDLTNLLIATKDADSADVEDTHTLVAASTRRLEVAQQDVSTIEKLFSRAVFLPRLRLWVEVLLPAAISVLAIVASAGYVWRHRLPI